jgi:hypothetical protein
MYRYGRWSLSGAVLAGLGCAPALAADQPAATVPEPAAVVAQTADGGDVAARDGWTAWSTKTAAGRWRLMVRAPGGTVAIAPVPSRGAPFDVRLGQGADGREQAVYSRCSSYGQGRHGCRLYRLDLGSGDERRLALARGDVSETLPAIAGGRLAYASVRRSGADAVAVRDLGTGRVLRQPRGRLHGGRPTKVVAIDFDGRRIASIWTGRSDFAFSYALFTQRLGAAARLGDVTEITGDGCGNTYFRGVALTPTAAFTLNAGGAGWQVQRVGFGPRAKPTYGPYHRYPVTEGTGLSPDASDGGLGVDGGRLVVSATTAVWQFPTTGFTTTSQPVHDDSACA